MKKYLVTGGCGFIGSHLVDELSKNNKVIVLDNLYTGNKKNINLKNKNIDFHKIDLSKYNKKLEKLFKNVDTVFHLAGIADIVPSITNPELYFNVNVNGTLNILRCSKINRVNKIVYAASASCYGVPKKFPTNENEEIKLNYPYALSKKLGEDLIMHWGKVYNLNVSSLRLFNVYGLRSRTSGAYGAAFGVFLAQKLNNFPLTIVGNGKQTRDFIFVKDVVSAFISSSKLKKSGYIFNVGSGVETNINYIASKISSKKIYIPKRPGEPDRSLADISKIKRILKWKPVISIDQGINVLLKNIFYWKGSPVWTPGKIKKATKVWFQYLKK